MGPVPIAPAVDTDPAETQEWIDSLDAVITDEGPMRARLIMTRLMERARERFVPLPATAITDYVNTIGPADEPPFPGDEEMERRIRRITRWNAAAIVTRANLRNSGIGGHLSTYASAASLYEVGFNHFFRGKDGGGAGDQIFFQGHATPGIYARAFLEGRLSEAQLDGFRTELHGGLSSYPHPRLMPDFWEFPSVSMGLGPLNAVYQARFNRYLHDRGISDTSGSRVWCFLGDGETDEPEATAALTLAARESLSNLVFVVNCNLQRLDGPVRGNGKVIQELEGIFRGAGWNVIKVIWAREWDPLIANDSDGLLRDRMNNTVDGEYQKYAVESGDYVRRHAFGPDPRLLQMVEHLSDDDLRHLRRGGHDYRKLYAAYRYATEFDRGPTVILAKTIKGWVLGPVFEARNATHQMKKISGEEARVFRDRLDLPIPDASIGDGQVPYYHPGEKSPEVEYLRERRSLLGGYVPHRLVRPKPLSGIRDEDYAELMGGTGSGSEASTTGAFVRVLRNLMRNPEIGRRVVPIIPDEARTFGMDALFHEFGIYAPRGQLYEAVDANLVLSYREARDGQILEEGITEAGSMGTMTAAATSYATHGEPMIPFFIFYSMFGFQRVGDSVWSMGDARGRGFLLGGTAGRTTLNGEGLQHQDGHSLLLASVVPNLRSYDPAFAYEVAVIVREGMRRMLTEQADEFYYLTLYNETYPMPALPAGNEEGIIRGIHPVQPADQKAMAHLFGSGSMIRAALEAQALLRDQFQVDAAVWSVTSYQLLRNDALSAERWNRLHPGSPPRSHYLAQVLGPEPVPVVAVSDWMKAVPDQVARFLPGSLTVLGTDGYGRSDTRAGLRRHFEIDAQHVALAALTELARTGGFPAAELPGAVARLGIDPELPDPREA
ncbi:MAG: pyruvate dehydrogenase (acetyl-transferring), homodimeric type [Candidatus Dormibacteria bacterium]